MDLKMRRERIISWVQTLEDKETLAALEQWAEDDLDHDHSPSDTDLEEQTVYQLTARELELLEEASNSVKSGHFLTNEEVSQGVDEWLGE